MENRIWGASRQRALDLAAAGCPIDYLEAIPRRASQKRNVFHAEQLVGYAESRAYILGPSQVGYLIGVRLGTERPSGTVITDWNFEPPWPGHATCFDYEPQDVIPHADHRDYRDLFDSPLMKVLDSGRRLRQGCPIEGLLSGFSYQPTPESCEGSVSGKLTFLDTVGNRVVLDVEMAVVHTPQVRADVRPPRTRRIVGCGG